MTLSLRSYVLAVVGIAMMLAAILAAVFGPSSAPLAEGDSPAFETVAASKITGNGACSTFKGKRTIHVCAPSKTPKGSPITRLYEDGSARYKNGSTYDGDDAVFKVNGQPV